MKLKELNLEAINSQGRRQQLFNILEAVTEFHGQLSFTDLDFNPGSKEFLYLPTHRCFAEQRGADTPVLGAAAAHTHTHSRTCF